MSFDIYSQTEVENFISQVLLESSWPFDLATQILCVIQLHNLSKKATMFDDKVIASTMEKATSFLEKGPWNENLHDNSSKPFKVTKEYVASAAIGLTASTSPIVTTTLSTLFPISSLVSLVPLALTTTPLLLNKKRKRQGEIKPAVLVPAEVMMYAKKHGKWLHDSKKPTSAAEQALPLTNQELSSNIETPSNPNVQLDEKALITKIRKEAGSKKGETWRNFVIEVLMPAVIRELDQGCLCLHRDLAIVLNEELSNGAKNFLGAKEYNKFNPGKIAEKIGDEIKNVFKSFDNSDNKKYKNVRSRVYRGVFYHEYDYVRCEQHLGK